MKLRKIAAGILAAAMAVMSVPQAVSAVDFEIDLGDSGFEVGDVFYVTFDTNTGTVTSGASSEFIKNDDEICYKCEVLGDRTLAVGTFSSNYSYIHKHEGKKYHIPTQLRDLLLQRLD